MSAKQTQRVDFLVEAFVIPVIEFPFLPFFASFAPLR
jgi:hypothetical protein